MQGIPPERPEDELIERLRGLETPQSANTLAELSYRRGREALEKALEDARIIRLAALDDARATRERELSSLLESLKALRQSAETEVAAIMTRAEIEASQLLDHARQEAEALLAKAAEDTARTRADVDALRQAAETRAREVERLEQEFNEYATRLAERIGLAADEPQGGWLRSLFRRDR